MLARALDQFADTGLDVRADAGLVWIWRTQGDERVRPTHAALEGREFGGVENPERDPEEGEPGDAYGCRCYKQWLPIRPTRTALERSEAQAVRAKRAGFHRNDRASDLAVVIRIDRAGIELAKPVSTPQGYWIVEGVASVEGVLHYSKLEPGGERDEYVPAEELERPESIASLKGMPITIEHEVDEVTPDNWQATAHGFIEDVWYAAGRLCVRIRITTREAIDAIRRGVRYLSLAYRVGQVDRTPGTAPDGRAYDLIQRRRLFDNCTLTRSPRAGGEAQIRLDSRAPAMTTPKTQLVHHLDSTGKSTKHTLTLAAISLATALAAGYSAMADKRTDADGEVPVGKLIVIKADGTKVELVLPEGQISDILAMVGAGTGAKPPPPAEAEAKPPDMDAAPMAAPMTEEKRGDALFARMDARYRENQYLDDVRARAREVLGGRPLMNLDAVGVMEATITLCRPDSGDSARAAQLAKQARDKRTDSAGRACGRLEELFEQCVVEAEAKRADAAKHRSDAADFLAEIEKPKAGDEKRTDAVGDARDAMIKRQQDRLKPKRSAA